MHSHDRFRYNFQFRLCRIQSHSTLVCGCKASFRHEVFNASLFLTLTLGNLTGKRIACAENSGLRGIQCGKQATHDENANPYSIHLCISTVRSISISHRVYVSLQREGQEERILNCTGSFLFLPLQVYYDIVFKNNQLRSLTLFFANKRVLRQFAFRTTRACRE